MGLSIINMGFSWFFHYKPTSTHIFFGLSRDPQLTSSMTMETPKLNLSRPALLVDYLSRPAPAAGGWKIGGGFHGEIGDFI